MSNSHSTKMTKVVGDVLGSKSNQKIGRVFEYGSDTLCDEETSVNVINEFFAYIGENIMKDLSNVEHKQLDPPNDTVKDGFNLISTVKFLEIVDELNYTKSSGVDDLNSRLIIDAMKGIPSIFVKICNKSLQSGVFPTSCKTARITVIPKKGDTRYLDNLRPISILSILGKVIEKFVKKRAGRVF